MMGIVVQLIWVPAHGGVKGIKRLICAQDSIKGDQIDANIDLSKAEAKG